MKNKRNRWLGVLICFFVALQINAAERKIDFIHYTNEDGLPSSYVKSIAQDADGFMWFATRAAVTRFDGQVFKKFPAYNTAGESIRIFGDKLFLFPDSILITRTINSEYFFFDEEQECFRPFDLLNNQDSIKAVFPSGDGVWLCQSHEISFLNSESGEKQKLETIYPSVVLHREKRFEDIREENGFIVILTGEGKILSIDKRNQEVRELEVPWKAETNDATLFFIDSGGHLWVGESYFGLACINLKNGRSRQYSREQEVPFHLAHNLVHCITEDHNSHVWIGTEAGLAIQDPATGMLELHGFDLSNPSGLNTNPIYDAFCDKEGNVWLGTYFGGINFWSNTESFFHIWDPGLGKEQLRGNVVSCLTEDQEGNLWIGLEDNGLNRFHRGTGNIIQYTTDTGAARLSYNNIHDLLFASDHELWIASYTGGINILDVKTNHVRYLTPDNTPGLTSNAVYAFFQAGDSIYIATSQGIVVYDKTLKSFSGLKSDVLGKDQFESVTGAKGKLWFSSSRQVYCYIPATDSLFAFDKVPEMTHINFVKADSKKRIWIGNCYKGLCLFDEDNDSLKYFNPENGFPVSWIFSLEEGVNGWFWASSDKGLVKFNPRENISILYDSNSGIPFNQFNYRASFIDREGNIYFGGNHGMVSFNENRHPQEQKEIPVMFTGMKLFNKEVTPGNNSALKRSVNKTDKIVLDYDQNVLTIEFSAFSYSSIDRCQFAYYLEGFENKWNFAGTRNFATYTNLSPGIYTFHVKASLGDIQEASGERQLKIIVRPPIFLSKGAFVSYLLIMIFLSFLIFRIGKNIERSKAMLAMERKEREHEEEIHRVKLEFFTNISHELKTPLTLILGPLNKLIKDEPLSPAFRKALAGIERNANRLFLLINQLLEFRKIENGKDSLKVSECDVAVMSEEIADAFRNLADAKDIEFVVHSPNEGAMVWLDADKVDKIIVNLLSNAFKFTKEGGRIVLSVEIVPRERSRQAGSWDMLVKVADSGKGIQPEMLSKVFDRFFHIEDNSESHENSGIGLAYVKSLVMLHRGSVNVESEIDKGAVFSVRLPVSKSDYSKTEILSCKQQFRSKPPELMGDSFFVGHKQDFSERFSGKPSVLLVEDNTELVAFLEEILEVDYEIVSAGDGVYALEKLKDFKPNLIISDIMMPRMDGIELTKRIKSELETSHIPIILLTSKNGVKNELEGLMTGADYYIEKPFYPEMLVRIIKNILNTRQRVIERFKDESSFETGELSCSESDKAFIEKLTDVVKSNINESSLDVSFLLKEMRVSRSLLHIKLKGLVGCSATEFIRTIRLKEAARLISSGKCNISEAAYETGFSSPAYFTRCFKDFYGKSPREYYNS
jgi:signal transduction histidine kinase/ligand-binding sensor domain-containing protein/DNA-binding response OmpR family regulator